MGDGVSLPSDFTPIPQVMREHAEQAFVTRSLEILGTMVGPIGSEAPIQMDTVSFAMGGQYIEQPIIKNDLGINKRDITSNSALTAQKLVGANNRGVLVHRRSDLVEFTDDVRWAGWSAEQLNAAFGRMLGPKVFDDMLSTAIAALVGAVEAVGSSAHVYSPWSATDRQNLTPAVIENAALLVGDRASALRYILTRSQPASDMRLDAAARGYDYVGGRALEGNRQTNTWGMKIGIRDDATLTVADGGFDKYKTLLLGPGAIRIGMPQPVEIEADRRIDRETKTSQVRADWSLSIHVPTMQYDGSTSGANPANSGLATAANWTDNTTSDREVPIVEIVHNTSSN